MASLRPLSASFVGRVLTSCWALGRPGVCARMAFASHVLYNMQKGTVRSPPSRAAQGPPRRDNFLERLLVAEGNARSPPDEPSRRREMVARSASWSAASTESAAASSSDDGSAAKGAEPPGRRRLSRGSLPSVFGLKSRTSATEASGRAHGGETTCASPAGAERSYLRKPKRRQPKSKPQDGPRGRAVSVDGARGPGRAPLEPEPLELGPPALGSGTVGGDSLVDGAALGAALRLAAEQADAFAARLAAAEERAAAAERALAERDVALAAAEERARAAEERAAEAELRLAGVARAVVQPHATATPDPTPTAAKHAPTSAPLLATAPVAAPDRARAAVGVAASPLSSPLMSALEQQSRADPGAVLHRDLTDRSHHQ